MKKPEEFKQINKHGLKDSNAWIRVIELRSWLLK